MTAEQMHVERFTDAGGAISEAIGLIGEALAASRDPSLALSGGQTPRRYLTTLAGSRDWSATRVTLADERWIDSALPDSNERLVRDLFVDVLPAARRPVFIPMWLPGQDVFEGARSYAARWGSRPLSVVVLGMGDDGHIASLFPDSPALEAPDPLCVPVLDAPAPYRERLSLSPRAIVEAAFVILIVAGACKLDVFDQAMVAYEEHTKPVALLNRRRPGTTRVIALPEGP